MGAGVKVEGKFQFCVGRGPSLTQNGWSGSRVRGPYNFELVCVGRQHKTGSSLFAVYTKQALVWCCSTQNNLLCVTLPHKTTGHVFSIYTKQIFLCWGSTQNHGPSSQSTQNNDKSFCAGVLHKTMGRVFSIYTKQVFLCWGSTQNHGPSVLNLHKQVFLCWRSTQNIKPKAFSEVSCLRLDATHF